jgi:hypothetical protein
MKQTPHSLAEKPTVKETSMNFSFGSGHDYADNSEFASKGLRFDVLAVAFEPGRGFEGQDRWLVTVKVADREPELLSLGSNPKRDEQLKAAEAHLAHGGAIKNVRLRQSGKAYYFTESDS